MTGDADDRSARARAAALAAALTARPVLGLDPIAPGLGARRFFRVRLGGDGPPTLIARIEGEPPTRPGLPPPEPALEPVRAWLAEHGVPVPARLGGDEAAGVELLEDVGDESLERAVAGADADRRRRLYREAVDLVPRIQRVPPTDPARVPAFGRRLDAELIATKAHKWLSWVVPVALGRGATAGERAATEDAFAFVARVAEAAPPRLAHRDLKAANVHRVPDPAAPTGARPVLIDLQGAFLAPPEYDLVCLLRDAHVPLPDEEVDDHLAHVRPALPDAPGPDAFARRFDLLSVVRIAKDVAHYVDASTTRGDHRYLRFIAQGLANLRRATRRAAARDDAIAPFARHLDDVPDGLPDDLARRTGPPATGGKPCAP